MRLLGQTRGDKAPGLGHHPRLQEGGWQLGLGGCEVGRDGDKGTDLGYVLEAEGSDGWGARLKDTDLLACEPRHRDVKS